MKSEIGLFFLVWLIQGSVGFSYDEECFANYSQSFPSIPEIKAEKIQVDIVHTVNGKFKTRRQEILNRGQEQIFTYTYPDTIDTPRNLTLYFDGSTVFGAMAAYTEYITNETMIKWECLNSSRVEMNFDYYTVSNSKGLISYNYNCFFKRTS